MANKRQSKEKQALILAALSEGTPMRAVARMFKTDKKRIARVIRETGEAFADYMDRNFRDLPCIRIEMDEQWQYVGAHGMVFLSSLLPSLTDCDRPDLICDQEGPHRE